MSILAIALTSALACQAIQNNEFIGLWESTNKSKGGIGNNIEFKKNGSFVSAVTVLVDLNYRLKEGILYVNRNPGEPISNDTGTQIHINSDSIVMVDPEGNTQEKKRIHPNPSKSIVGEYRYRHYTGGIAYEKYTSDGVMMFRLPMNYNKGCYELEGNKILFTQENKTQAASLFNVTKDSLVLEGKTNRVEYRRVPWGGWYDSEHIDYKKP